MKRQEKAKIIREFKAEDPLYRFRVWALFVKRKGKYRIQVIHYQDGLVIETKYVEFDKMIIANRFWSDLRSVYFDGIAMPTRIPF